MTALAADLEQFVQQEITSGRFPNRESVVAHCAAAAAARP